MFILRAPYPALNTTTLLPSPSFGDQVNLKATVKTLRTMDGTLHTYITCRDAKHKLKWDFKLSKNKALELREFIKAYNSSVIHITDHENNVWVGYLKNNPFEFTSQSRAGGWPGEELIQVTLEFEEK